MSHPGPLTVLAAIAIVATLGFAAGTGRSSAGTPAVTCHGRPATIVGTPGDDVFGPDTDLKGNAVLVTRGGDDHVFINVQNVTVCAGSGRDSVMTGADVRGRDTLLDGGKGRDRLGNAESSDFLTATPLEIHGGGGGDRISGSGGGNKSGDEIYGGPGTDKVWGNRGADLIRGQSDDDRLFGEGNPDRLFGGAGDDRLIGDDTGNPDQPHGPDRATGGGGSDTCRAETKVSCES